MTHLLRVWAALRGAVESVRGGGEEKEEEQQEGRFILNIMAAFGIVA